MKPVSSPSMANTAFATISMGIPVVAGVVEGPQLCHGGEPAFEPAVTDWIEGDPARAGWYDVQVAWSFAPIRRWWNGSFWLTKPGGVFCADPGKTFRGLAAKG